jgi:hypothetical protein
MSMSQHRAGRRRARRVYIIRRTFRSRSHTNVVAFAAKSFRSSRSHPSALFQRIVGI